MNKMGRGKSAQPDSEHLNISLSFIRRYFFTKAQILKPILGDGEITRALKVTAAKFSESAKAKIEKAGGQAIVG